MNIAFPFGIGADGRTRAAADPDHIRQMIELLLFTQPGERVMRPGFGTGLLRYVFSPNSQELAATLQLTVQGALTQWLGDLVELRSVAVTSDDATLRVTVAYAVRSTGDVLSETFIRSVS